MYKKIYEYMHLTTLDMPRLWDAYLEKKKEKRKEEAFKDKQLLLCITV